MKHKEEIIRWANCPDDTGVWTRNINAKKEWIKLSIPFWSNNRVYVVDDEYAELRKAQADGESILFNGNRYNDLDFDSPLEYYSIEKKFIPILKKSIESGRVMCFIGLTKGVVIDDNGSVEYDVGEVVNNLVRYDNELHWEDVR